MWAPPPLPRTLEASLRDLESKTPATKASAISDLVRHALRSDETRVLAIGHIERALRDDAPVVRSAACVALADLRAEEALASLLVVVEDPEAYVRQMAISALGEIGDTRAAPRLVRALVDQRPEVRYQALIAYTRLEEVPSDADAALTRAFADSDCAIRHIAVRLAEDRLDDRDRSAPGDLYLNACPLLDDSNGAVRAAAAVFLSKAGDVNAQAVLLAIVRREVKGAEKEDEQEAIELVGRLNLRQAIPHLESRAWGPMRWVRDTSAWHAKIALARMGHGRAESEILRDLQSIRRHIREAAVVAAGRARLQSARTLLETMQGAVDDELLTDALARLM